ncbi:TRAP transporter large permease subunit, partial [Mesorhizobium sp. M4B.F.Ca.ET.089.01.1.1]|uniref:TRAP transporter large permease subunit n=1 Tax=Mesorhizobium sp. M4B.F.Ca.ET.089.01.1.1 TaxID=2496662 RepID=UPI000FE2D906
VIMMIMALATPFSFILAVEQIPTLAADWISGYSSGPVVTVLLILFVLSAVGFWLDLGPSLIIMTPILVPIARDAGLQPFQTGVLFTITLGAGLFTPPVGTNITVVCNIAKLDMYVVSKWLMPYWIASLVCIAGIAFFPGMTEWLPSLFGM